METIFRVGMKVYDQLMFPDKEGVVLTTNYIPEKIFDEDDFDEDYVHPYPILVEFGSEEMLYTKDGDCEMCSVKTLSTKPYKVELQGFEQKAPAPTFEEAWTETDRIYEPKSEYDKEEFGGYPSQELANAAEALRRLLFLRDYYNEGWQPDWSDNDTIKFTIFVNFKDLSCDVNYSINRIFAFKSKEIAEKFFKEQKELLEIAKPLL